VVTRRILFALGLLLGTSSAASAQYQTTAGDSNGITVFGTGELQTLPNIVEIDLRAGGSAELTADSIVKYQDTKRRVLEAFEELKLPDLSIEEHGLSLSAGGGDAAMQMMMNGMVTDTKTQVEISSMLRLRLNGIREKKAEEVLEIVGKLLDVAQDSGTSLGPSSAEIQMAYRYGRMSSSQMVRFIVTDLEEIREQAYESAVADARRRAERLARLNGVSLGTVLGVQEILVSGDDSSTYNVYQPWSGVATQPSYADEPQLASDTFSEVPFRVRLMVRFAIAAEETRTAQE